METPVIQRAQHLRANMTGVETRMWWRLRARRLGVKFRRQHPIGPYIVDFACCRAKLVVEIDGETHQKAYDLHPHLASPHGGEGLGLWLGWGCGCRFLLLVPGRRELPLVLAL